jgi:hypothetical protein
MQKRIIRMQMNADFQDSIKEKISPGIYLRKSAFLEMKKAESSLTLPPCKSMAMIVSGPKNWSSQEPCQRWDDVAIQRSTDSFMASPITSPGDPYLFSTRMKYTWLLKTCSGTSSFAQFMIDC